MKIPSQRERLLSHLEAGKSITSLEAFNTLGITQLSARVVELEKQGVAIRHNRIKVKNRFGETVNVTQYSKGE